MRKTLVFPIIIVAILAGATWWYTGVPHPAEPAETSAPLATSSTAIEIDQHAVPAQKQAGPIEDTAIAPPTATTSQNTETGAEQSGVTVTFRAGAETYPARVIDGSDVFSLMEKLRESEGFRFTSENHPGMGQFVTSIDGKPNEGRYYWFLYVNGVSSPTGASATKLHAGDSVEWRYEKSY